MTEGEFANQQQEMLKEIPKEFRSAMSYKAWEDGHSAGYEEVILLLSNLIDAFKEPIEEFEHRIRKEIVENRRREACSD
jgi:flagellar biosynthesis/type III secretory pathway protein FliH